MSPIADLPAAIARLSDRADEMRELLTQWAEINSGSGHTAGLDRMREALKAACALLPGHLEEVPVGTASPETAPANRALRVTCRPEAPVRVLLCGHYDTVYGPDHPFQHCERVDAKTLRGPGVLDMKGGLVLMLAALQAFETLPHASRLGWELIVTPDEETGSVASGPLLEQAAQRNTFGLVFEPAFGADIVRSRKGVGSFTVVAHGRAAHAGRDFALGRNAIVALADFLLAADALNREFDEVIVNVARITGGGPLNIVPDRAQAELNIRVRRRPDARRVVHILENLAARLSDDGIRVEFTGEFNRLPMESTPASEALFAAYQACARDLGTTIEWRHTGGGSDGNLLAAAGLPVLDGLGPRGGGMHSDSEYVILDSMVERAQFAALFLDRIATGRISIPIPA